MQMVGSQGDPHQHQQTQGPNGVMGSMFQVDQLLEGPFPGEHQGEGTDEQGPKTQAHHDQDDV